MGDHRAGSTGPTATALTAPAAPTAPAPGRRVARHAAEQRTSQPYAGRRVAQVAPTPAESISTVEEPTTPPREASTYTGRRVAGRDPVSRPAEAASAEEVEAVGRVVGRRMALDPELTGVLADDLDDVSAHLLRPTTAPTLEPYAGRRIARDLPLIVEPTVDAPDVAAAPVVEEPTLEVVPEIEPPVAEPLAVAPLLVAPTPPAVIVERTLAAAPAVQTPLVVEKPVLETTLAPVEPLVDEPVVDEPVVDEPADEPVVEAPTLVVDPQLVVSRERRGVGTRVAAKQSRPTGRRVASRRTRMPSLPLLAGVAVLAISTCGALQAVHPGLAGADAGGRLSPASALSGSSAVGSANLLSGRGAVVSRDSDRQALSSASGSSLQAAADAQAKQRDAALSALRGRAEKQAAEIKLHQWVLPVTPGVYHLTARFGDYSSLWTHFHTGLDFAAPTGTPIMAVAGGTITEVGYSGAYGNRTIETLPDGTELWYCHQNEFGTSVGATVKPGQVIGYVGSTGNVTGPHLHLEVHPGGGDPVDPYTALIVHGLQP